MKIDMRTTTPTMQEVVDLCALVAMDFAFLLKEEEAQADEFLTTLCGALEMHASRERAPRLRAMLSGVAEYLHAGDEPMPPRKPNQPTR